MRYVRDEGEMDEQSPPPGGALVIGARCSLGRCLGYHPETPKRFVAVAPSETRSEGKPAYHPTTQTHDKGMHRYITSEHGGEHGGEHPCRCICICNVNAS
jgi:hypothetical protein